eukprot:1157119-Pelagomonas_calceolata.AAC.14
MQECVLASSGAGDSCDLLRAASLAQIEEHEDYECDSVTKLHQDMSDAVNVLIPFVHDQFKY